VPLLSKATATPQAAEVVEVEEEAEEEEEAECTPSVQVATFAAGDSPLEAGLEYFRRASCTGPLSPLRHAQHPAYALSSRP
jgi:hypothetical protein